MQQTVITYISPDCAPIPHLFTGVTLLVVAALIVCVFKCLSKKYRLLLAIILCVLSLGVVSLYRLKKVNNVTTRPISVENLETQPNE